LSEAQSKSKVTVRTLYEKKNKELHARQIYVLKSSIKCHGGNCADEKHIAT
jgi:hypothetical protein